MLCPWIATDLEDSSFLASPTVGYWVVGSVNFLLGTNAQAFGTVGPLLIVEPSPDRGDTPLPQFAAKR